MSLPTRASQDVIAGRDSHMLVVCNMLTGLLRCWHVRSSHVASGMTVTWLVRTDGFFATSRDTTSLDPDDQSRTQIFEHRSSRRSSAVVGFLCRGLPIVELALLGSWRWSCHVGRKKFSSMVDIYEDKFSRISKIPEMD